MFVARENAKDIPTEVFLFHAFQHPVVKMAVPLDEMLLTRKKLKDEEPVVSLQQLFVKMVI